MKNQLSCTQFLDKEATPPSYTPCLRGRFAWAPINQVCLLLTLHFFCSCFGSPLLFLDTKGHRPLDRVLQEHTGGIKYSVGTVCPVLYCRRTVKNAEG